MKHEIGEQNATSPLQKVTVATQVRAGGKSSMLFTNLLNIISSGSGRHKKLGFICKCN